jgi:tight adherence protein C
MAVAGLKAADKGDPGTRFRHFPAYRAGVARLGRAFSPRPAAEVCGLLETSGSAWTPQYLQGLRIVAGLALSVLAIPLGLAGLLLTPLFFAAGYRAPVMALKRKSSRRWERVAADLPEVVDLMAVLCFSGESLFQALRHSAGACSHPVSREVMERVLEPVLLGESAATALRHAADHPCREIRRFSRTLLRAEEFGAPVADTLEELAVELANARREKDRVRASRVSVLILLPLVFLILPSFLLLTVGGMILGHTL